MHPDQRTMSWQANKEKKYIWEKNEMRVASLVNTLVVLVFVLNTYIVTGVSFELR